MGGFSVVQIAHRIETLTRSDVLYFIEHGRVVEVGGLESLNGKAVEELSSVDIEYTKVINPETRKEEERLSRGFYRQLHEAYYDLDFHQMGLPQLLKKVRSLEEQLAKANFEKDAKMRPLLGMLSAPVPLERATSEPNAPQKSSTAETETVESQGIASPCSPLAMQLLSLSRFQSAA